MNKAFQNTPARPQRIDGRDLRIFVATDKGAESTPIACAKSCAIDIRTIFDNTSDKDSAANAVQPLRTEFDATSTNLLMEFDAFQDLVVMQAQRKPLYMTFAALSNPSQGDVQDVEGKKWTKAENKGLVGMVYIESLSLNAPNEGKAECTIKLKGSGELKPLGNE